MTTRQFFALVVAAGCLSTGCHHSSAAKQPTVARPAMITVTSPDFAAGAMMPSRFTCDGPGISPALHWSDVPAGSASIALVVDDPDAPSGTFTHWLVVDIDPALTAIATGTPPSGARQLPNSAGKATYSPACPPSGSPHHYRFTVYALSRRIDTAEAGPLADVRTAIQAAATAEGTLVGIYRRHVSTAGVSDVAVRRR